MDVIYTFDISKSNNDTVFNCIELIHLNNKFYVPVYRNNKNIKLKNAIYFDECCNITSIIRTYNDQYRSVYKYKKFRSRKEFYARYDKRKNKFGDNNLNSILHRVITVTIDFLEFRQLYINCKYLLINNKLLKDISDYIITNYSDKNRVLFNLL